ncbi:porin [Caballeronia sp. INDeC2]|uniref:porin n=1 Tax=Caballeronia sp. INDeC2 TaxID=2921747 RepID=UPI00202847EB|nr:porin [Caballeronia sp. INDeC2]
MKKYVTPVVVASLSATAACAQSSVTLYGIVDSGLMYQNNGTTVGSAAKGHSSLKLSPGGWALNRFGLKGNEDVGAGTSAIFQLESGFNIANGSSQFAGGLFTRQAWVGLANERYGTLTAGRQYTAYFTLLSPYSPALWLTGAGAHPGDIDSLDLSYRANNSLVYMSPAIHGFTFGGSYAFGGVPGSMNAGSAWSAGVQYVNGPAGIAAAFQRVNNATPGGGAWGENSAVSNGGAQAAVSAINYGYITAQAQQRVAVTAGYRFSPAWDVSVSYSNVQYIPGLQSAFRDTAIFNTAGTVLHYKPTPSWDLAAGYSYTRATQANGISSEAAYQQVVLSQYYSLSKRTGLYAVEGYQHARGQTLSGGKVVDATASIGDSFAASPSSTGNQLGLLVGLNHRF